MAYFKLISVNNLPFYCPLKGAEEWNKHPKVFLKFNAKGEAFCPYCSSSYKLDNK